jgi:hypothetical protein
MRRLAPILLALSLVLPGCRGGAIPEPPPIDPFVGYFMSLRPTGTYLFDVFAKKQAFDRILTPIRPGDESSGEFAFQEFVDVAGNPVFISAAGSQKELTPEELLAEMDDGDEEPLSPLFLRIARGYELQEDTTLFRLSEPDAPPVGEETLELLDEDPL